MSDHNKGGEVVSLDEFRQRTSKPETNIPFVDGLTFDHALRALNYLGELSNKGEIVMIASQDVDTPATLQSARNGKQAHLISRNEHDLAILGEYAEAYEDPMLSTDLDRLYSVTVLSRGILLERQEEFDVTLIKSPPLAGNEPINPGDRERALELGSWRAGAGVSLQTLYVGDGSRKHDIDDYLHTSLATRLSYDRGRAEYDHLLGRRTRNPPEVVPDSIIGICNPLKEYELKLLVTPAKRD